MRKIIIICVMLILVIAGVVLLFGKKAEDKDNLEPAIEQVAAERSGEAEDNFEPVIEQAITERPPEAEGQELQPGKEEWKSATPVEMASDDHSRPVIELFIDEMWMFGNNQDQIIENLGAPLDAKRHEDSGQYPYVSTCLEYEGLAIGLWSDLMHDQYVNYVSLSSEKYATSFGIKVGSLVEEVIEFLGEPTEKEQGQITYIYDMVVTDGVIRFHFVDGIITKIEWDIGVI